MWTGGSDEPATKPLAQWEQVQAFDAAEACERYRSERTKSLTADAAAYMSKKGETPAGSFSDRWAALLALYRCVPADHIYPPKQPGPTK